jgi:murein DD-endopeptidase MepM/ murein hydrolase activator NlpD
MIKQDYKPRNYSKAFSNNAFDNLPAWATHPFAIISYATITLILAITLFKDNKNSTEETMIESSIDIVLEEAQSVKQIEYDSGQINLGLSDSIETNDSSSSDKHEESNNVVSQNVSRNQNITINPDITENQSVYNNQLLPLKSNYSTPNIQKESAKYTPPTAIALNFTNSSKLKYQLKPLLTSSKWKSESVKKNDNLSLIFKRIGLTPQMVYKISTLDKNTKILTNLMPGRSIYYQLGQNKELLALKYVIDLQNTLYVERRNADTGISEKNELVSRMVNKTIEYRTAYISGTITDSLFLSGKRAGMSDSLIINFANIFAWDIDFTLDIRAGDSFSLLYQEEFLDGEKIRNGNIIAADFINRGDIIRAISYTDSKNNSDFYSDTGHSMRKAFLRAPVNFKYISDSFNPRRFHPVQKRIKPHRGIDYAAPVGTPIRASGDGKVIASGYNKFNGKYIFIQHGNSIVTKYLHLSKRLVSRGKRVKQGQIIGKLGSTGMVTGPHLHYEFVVNGVHRNPRTVKLPKAEAISRNEKANFLIASKVLVTQLENRKQIQSSLLAAK